VAPTTGMLNKQYTEITLESNIDIIPFYETC